MKKEILIKLFSPDKQTSIIATIQKRISGELYQLIDDSGRIFQARSPIVRYPLDRVLIQNDVVVSVIGKGNEIKTYMV